MTKRWRFTGRQSWRRLPRWKTISPRKLSWLPSSSRKTAALEAARKQLDIATNRYQAGLVTYLEVATAQNIALQQEADCDQLAWHPVGNHRGPD